MRWATTIMAATALLAGASWAGEVYRWVDEDGVVHYTDRPPAPDAEPAKLPPIQTVPPRTIAAPQAAPGDGEQPVAAPPPDYRLRIVSPQRDAVLRDPQPVVTVQIAVEPPLAPGHGLRVFLDGRPVQETPIRQTTLSIPDVGRGSHSLSVSIVDEQGRVLASTEAVPFHRLPPVVRRRPAGQ